MLARQALRRGFLQDSEGVHVRPRFNSNSLRSEYCSATRPRIAQKLYMHRGEGPLAPNLTAGRKDAEYETSSLLRPLRSTYLDLRLCHVLWKIADDDLAVASSLVGECPSDSSRLSVGPVLLNASGRCLDGGFGFRLGGAGRSWAALAAACWLAGVLHDLVQGLVEFSRHVEGVKW